MGDRRMPEASLYEEELKYMPYRDSLRKVVDLIVNYAPEESHLVDIMCGTGHLLREIKTRREDLNLTGVDIDSRYIDFARDVSSGITFEEGDVLHWRPRKQFDVFTCTGALHHITYKSQGEAIQNIADMIHHNGFGIISDCYIDSYANEIERKLAATRLGYEYLKETIRNGSPDSVTAVTADILRNDVLGIEFKTALAHRLPIFMKLFEDVETFKIWPNEQTEFGDFVTVLKNRIRQ